MRAIAAASLTSLALLAGCGGGKADAPVPKPVHRAVPAKPAPNGPVVLGAKGFLDNRAGWGTPHPGTIDGGSDPATVINRIHWRRWGRSTAVGAGLTAAFHLGLGGTYYHKLVRAELRAYDLGRCKPNGPRAYLQLKVRMPEKPGAPMGPWFDWGGTHGLCSYP